MAIMGLKQMAFIRTGGDGGTRLMSARHDTHHHSPGNPVTKSRCVIMGTRKSVNLWIGRVNVHYDFTEENAAAAKLTHFFPI